jgi:hypothetical protein
MFVSKAYSQGGSLSSSALIQGNLRDSEALSVAKAVAAAFNFSPLPLQDRPRVSRLVACSGGCRRWLVGYI